MPCCSKKFYREKGSLVALNYSNTQILHKNLLEFNRVVIDYFNKNKQNKFACFIIQYSTEYFSYKII